MKNCFIVKINVDSDGYDIIIKDINGKEIISDSKDFKGEYLPEKMAQIFMGGVISVGQKAEQVYQKLYGTKN